MLNFKRSFCVALAILFSGVVFQHAKAVSYAEIAGSVLGQAVHANDLNVVDATGTVYWLNPSGTKDPYPSMDVLLSWYNGKAPKIYDATEADLARSSGSIVPSKSSLSDISQGPSAAAPADYSAPATGNNPAANLVNDNGTIFLVTDGAKIGIPDVATLQSWDLDLSQASPATPADTALPETGVLKNKSDASGDISSSQLSAIATPTAKSKSPLSLDSVTVSAITDSSAVVTWLTNLPATSALYYGKDKTFGATSTDGSLTTSHSLTLDNLQPNTTYYFKAASTDANGNANATPDPTFKTAGKTGGGGGASKFTVSSVTATNITSSSMTITWSTNQSSDSTVNYGLTTAYGSTAYSATLVKSHSLTLSNLTASTMYHYQVVSKNSVGGMAQSADLTAITAVNNVDTTAPTTPINLLLSNTTATSTTLSWSASTDTDSPSITYQIYRNGSKLLAVTATSYNDVNLTPATNYSYQVSASDPSGNTSSLSNTVNVTTLATADTVPPTVSITSPTASSTLSGTVALTASAADNVAVRSVQFLVDGANVGSADTSTPYTYSLDTTTLTNGNHSISAKAVDTSGNTATATAVAVTVSNAVATMLPRDVWVWQSSVATDATAEQQLFSFAPLHDIKNVYVESESLIQNNQPALAKFINDAAAKGIGVELLFGNSSWALTANQPYAVNLAKLSATFASGLTGAKPLGVHYDVEPYLLSQWTADANGVANQYLDLLEQLKTALTGSSLRLTVDSPFWFDSCSYCNTFTRNGASIDLSHAVLDRVDRVAYMDYNDYASNMINFVSNELNYAQTTSKQAVIGASVESGEPTFADEGETYMNNILQQVNAAYAANSAFKGFTIEDYANYLLLKQ